MGLVTIRAKKVKTKWRPSTGNSGIVHRHPYHGKRVSALCVSASTRRLAQRPSGASAHYSIPHGPAQPLARHLTLVVEEDRATLVSAAKRAAIPTDTPSASDLLQLACDDDGVRSNSFRFARRRDRIHPQEPANNIRSANWTGPRRMWVGHRTSLPGKSDLALKRL